MPPVGGEEEALPYFIRDGEPMLEEQPIRLSGLPRPPSKVEPTPPPQLNSDFSSSSRTPTPGLLPPEEDCPPEVKIMLNLLATGSLCKV